MRISPGWHRIVRYVLAGSLVFALVLGALLPSALLAASSGKAGVPAVEQMGNRGGYYSHPNARYDAHTAYRYNQYNQRQYTVYGNGRYCNQYSCTQPNYSHNRYRDSCDGQWGYAYYRVHRGDTLSEIARDYGVSVQSLARANNLRNPHRIYAGQSLYIPTNSPCHR